MQWWIACMVGSCETTPGYHPNEKGMDSCSKTLKISPQKRPPLQNGRKQTKHDLLAKLGSNLCFETGEPRVFFSRNPALQLPVCSFIPISKCLPIISQKKNTEISLSARNKKIQLEPFLPPFGVKQPSPERALGLQRLVTGP